MVRIFNLLSGFIKNLSESKIGSRLGMSPFDPGRLDPSDPDDPNSGYFYHAETAENQKARLAKAQADMTTGDKILGAVEDAALDHPIIATLAGLFGAKFAGNVAKLTAMAGLKGGANVIGKGFGSAGNFLSKGFKTASATEAGVSEVAAGAGTVDEMAMKGLTGAGLAASLLGGAAAMGLFGVRGVDTHQFHKPTVQQEQSAEDWRNSLLSKYHSPETVKDMLNPVAPSTNGIQFGTYSHPGIMSILKGTKFEPKMDVEASRKLNDKMPFNINPQGAYNTPPAIYNIKGGNKTINNVVQGGGSGGIGEPATGTANAGWSKHDIFNWGLFGNAP
jgi:hypothetical protein